jgi:hypothetical protein
MKERLETDHVSGAVDRRVIRQELLEPVTLLLFPVDTNNAAKCIRKSLLSFS